MSAAGIRHGAGRVSRGAAGISGDLVQIALHARCVAPIGNIRRSPEGQSGWLRGIDPDRGSSAASSGAKAIVPSHLFWVGREERCNGFPNP